MPKIRKRSSREQVKATMDFLDRDPQIATLAKKYGLARPRQKRSYDGHPLVQNPKNVRQRMHKLVRRLREDGVNVQTLMKNGTLDKAPATLASVPERPTSKLSNVVYGCVTTFNARRMMGQTTIELPMDDFEEMLTDYLRRSGVGPAALVSEAEIRKLRPRP